MGLLNLVVSISFGMWDLSSPTRDKTHTPLFWECSILTTGLPEKPYGVD